MAIAEYMEKHSKLPSKHFAPQHHDGNNHGVIPTVNHFFQRYLARELFTL
jgi:hypothetical protein